MDESGKGKSAKNALAFFCVKIFVQKSTEAFGSKVEKIKEIKYNRFWDICEGAQFECGFLQQFFCQLALRTGVVLVMAWGIVFAKGKQGQIKMIDKQKLGYISLSGFATGASWLRCCYAVKNDIFSIIVPLGKLNLWERSFFLSGTKRKTHEESLCTALHDGSGNTCKALQEFYRILITDFKVLRYAV